MKPRPNSTGPACIPPIGMLFIHMMAPTAITNAETEPMNGQGLGSTRW